MLNTATTILIEFLRQDPNPDDIDRLVAMSAYMSKKLLGNLDRPLEQLEAEVWPELASPATDPEGEDSDTVL